MIRRINAMGNYSPYEGKVKVDTFQLDDPIAKASYEDILNDEYCTVFKEEFSYVGPTKSSPVVTIWYEDTNS